LSLDESTPSFLHHLKIFSLQDFSSLDESTPRFFHLKICPLQDFFPGEILSPIPGVFT
jgi:hypothetical protein